MTINRKTCLIAEGKKNKTNRFHFDFFSNEKTKFCDSLNLIIEKEKHSTQKCLDL